MRHSPSLALFFLLATYAGADNESEPAPAPFAPVIAEVEKIQAETGMRPASIGFAVIPLDTASETLPEPAGYRPDSAMIPASTMKLVTSATALEILGPEYRFQTELQHTGTLSGDGTLEGDVVIKGGGDPTLGASHIAATFSQWKTALTEAGITAINGRIVGDASIFGTQLRADSWQWNDLGNYYAAGACGLTFHQNLFYANFRLTNPGAPAPLAGTDPKLPHVQFVNEMRTGPAGSGDEGYVYGSPYGKLLYLRGTVPAGGASYTIKGSLPDPAFFCARAFTKHLNEHGIPVTGEPSTLRLMTINGDSPAEERHQLLVQNSDPLASLLVLTNHKSNNLRAECIHRAIGLKARGKGSTAEAAAATEAFWKTKGIDMTGFVMADGCGLSRADTITARQMALLLYHAAQSEIFDPFYASIPIAGQSGTLRSIGRGTASEGRIQAKSGTLDRIKCYAGYANAKSGKRYAFALFINHHDCTESQVKAKIVRVWNALVNP
jgi:D-alanyl-D-alanine carboxypeptidase/D-alanyl-D-alanine-endopeptidase (penicillin-binding protein 4)